MIIRDGILVNLHWLPLITRRRHLEESTTRLSDPDCYLILIER